MAADSRRWQATRVKPSQQKAAGTRRRKLPRHIGYGRVTSSPTDLHRFGRVSGSTCPLKVGLMPTGGDGDPSLRGTLACCALRGRDRTGTGRVGLGRPPVDQESPTPPRSRRPEVLREYSFIAGREVLATISASEHTRTGPEHRPKKMPDP